MKIHIGASAYRSRVSDYCESFIVTTKSDLPQTQLPLHHLCCSRYNQSLCTFQYTDLQEFIHASGKFDNLVELEALVSTNLLKVQHNCHVLPLRPWTTSRTEWHKVNISFQTLMIPANSSPEAAKPTPSPEV